MKLPKGLLMGRGKNGIYYPSKQERKWFMEGWKKAGYPTLPLIIIRRTPHTEKEV